MGEVVSWRLVYSWCDSTLIRSVYKRVADHDFWMGFKIFFKKGLFLSQSVILWLSFVPREARMLLQSTAEPSDFKG